MSLMSDTQGTPERVWALVELLDSLGGQVARDAVRRWLDPLETDQKGTAVNQTLGAAASLGLIERDTASVRLILDAVPRDIAAFADQVHEILIAGSAEQSNNVVLETFAWFVAMCGKQQGTAWIAQQTTESLVDLIRRDLSDEGADGRFNKTPFPRWKDWIGFVGLGLEVPARQGKPFLPAVTERLFSVLLRLSGVTPSGQPIAANTFVEAIAARMPYLDGGRLYEQAAERIGWAPASRHLGIVLSNALRALHDEGFIELRMYGDTADAFRLATDPTHRLQAFVEVIIKSDPGPAIGGDAP